MKNLHLNIGFRQIIAIAYILGLVVKGFGKIQNMRKKKERKLTRSPRAISAHRAYRLIYIYVFVDIPT